MTWVSDYLIPCDETRDTWKRVTLQPNDHAPKGGVFLMSYDDGKSTPVFYPMMCKFLESLALAYGPNAHVTTLGVSSRLYSIIERQLSEHPGYVPQPRPFIGFQELRIYSITGGSPIKLIKE